MPFFTEYILIQYKIYTIVYILVQFTVYCSSPTIYTIVYILVQYKYSIL